MPNPADGARQFGRQPVDPRTLPPVTGEASDYACCVYQNPVMLHRKRWQDWEDYWRRRGEDPPPAP